MEAVHLPHFRDKLQLRDANTKSRDVACLDDAVMPITQSPEETTLQQFWGRHATPLERKTRNSYPTYTVLNYKELREHGVRES